MGAPQPIQNFSFLYDQYTTNYKSSSDEELSIDSVEENFTSDEEYSNNDDSQDTDIVDLINSLNIADNSSKDLNIGDSDSEEFDDIDEYDDVNNSLEVNRNSCEIENDDGYESDYEETSSISNEFLSLQGEEEVEKSVLGKRKRDIEVDTNINKKARIDYLVNPLNILNRQNENDY
ncbi:hypothetical protein BN1013_01324 [Candidatus Rubidus massiliensis]|nr:hypothetical protein BN1013_01324 [Candidatus Rubidus massiliensis]